jgi:hypothetical protein
LGGGDGGDADVALLSSTDEEEERGGGLVSGSSSSLAAMVAVDSSSVSLFVVREVACFAVVSVLLWGVISRSGGGSFGLLSLVLGSFAFPDGVVVGGAFFRFFALFVFVFVFVFVGLLVGCGGGPVTTPLFVGGAGGGEVTIVVVVVGSRFGCRCWMIRCCC